MRQILHLLVYFPRSHSGQSRASLKPGARSFPLGLPCRCGVPSFKSAASQASGRELEDKWSSWSRNQHPCGVLVLRGGLACQAAAPGPLRGFFKSTGKAKMKTEQKPR